MIRAMLLGLTLAFAAASAFADLTLLATRGAVSNAPNDSRGTWGKRQAKVAYSQKTVDGVPAMAIQYQVDQPRQESGVWFGFSHFDIRPFERVEFQVRGAKGGEMLAFGIKDDRWFEQKIPLSRYLPGGITTAWQKVVIPIKDMAELRQPYSLDNWSLSFSNAMEGEKTGEVYVSEIRLIGPGGKLPLPEEQKLTFPLTFDPQTATDTQIMDVLQKSAFEFFWNEANPKNGLIKDACYAYGEDGMQSASVASVGFGLSAICVAEKRGWITREQACERVLNTLKFFRDEAEQHKGFYYHFYDMDTGYRSGECELSSIDTGLFLYGVITVKEHFKGTEIEKIAQDIIDRVEWNWMLLPNGFLSMGWEPEKSKQLIPHNWGGYNEGVMLYPLAIGSKKYPIPPRAWDNLQRETSIWNKRNHVPGTGDNALFTHQYPQCWLDLRKLKDARGINYFENSVQATWANHEWCLQNASQFKTFREGFWGLTASDGPDGYNVDGAPFSESNGTVAPTAPLGSFAFTPSLSMKAARDLFKIKDKVWGRYGFIDGFNLDRDWFSGRYIGIDQGPIVLMIENHRTGLIWDLTMRDESVREGLKKMGFVDDPSARLPERLPSESAPPAKVETPTAAGSAPATTEPAGSTAPSAPKPGTAPGGKGGSKRRGF